MKKRVLLVDDEEGILCFMESFLERDKIASVCASTGQEAIELYDKKTGLVILDVKLDDMDGFDVVKELKKINPAVKIILISGKPEKNFEAKAKQLGVLEYVTKPVDLEWLRHKVIGYLA